MFVSVRIDEAEYTWMTTCFCKAHQKFLKFGNTVCATKIWAHTHTKKEPKPNHRMNIRQNYHSTVASITIPIFHQIDCCPQREEILHLHAFPYRNWIRKTHFVLWTQLKWNEQTKRMKWNKETKRHFGAGWEKKKIMRSGKIVSTSSDSFFFLSLCSLYRQSLSTTFC